MIRRIRSGGPFEDKVGYCRAVVAGDTVHVAGTCSRIEPVPDDIVAQCRSAMEVVRDALGEAGCDFSDVVRVVYYLRDLDEFEACWPLLRAAFGAHPPAGTAIQARLVDPADRIEIEVTAWRPSA